MADTSSRVKYKLMQALQEKGPPSQAEFQPLGEWDYVGEEGEGMDTERGLSEEEYNAQEARAAARRKRRPTTVRQARKVVPPKSGKLP